MNKEAFLAELKARLSGLPQDDIEERLAFYGEMIADRCEDGVTEEEAVAGIGTVDAVVEQIMAEIPLTKLVKERVRPKRGLKVWEIVLLVLCSPVWIPLLIAGVVIVLALYIVIWAAVVCVYAADLSMAAGVLSAVASIVLYLQAGNPAGAVFAVGLGLVCAGGAILLFFASIRITKAIIMLSGKVMIGIKSLLVGSPRTIGQQE